MYFTKPMITLVQEIRRRVPDDLKKTIKFTNPNLLTELPPLYQSSNDVVTKAMIKELFHLIDSDSSTTPASDRPTQLMQSIADNKTEDKHHSIRVYRGQIQKPPGDARTTSRTATETTAGNTAENNRAGRIYRGQVIR